MEQLSKVKLQKSPYVKNLFYVDKKPNSYYMIIAETNTPVQKGTNSYIEVFGKQLELLIIMLGLLKKSKCNQF